MKRVDRENSLWNPHLIHVPSCCDTEESGRGWGRHVMVVDVDGFGQTSIERDV